MNWRRVTHNFTHNLGWKLASLGLASLIWIAYVGDPELVTMQAVPVLYRGLPPELLVVSGAPDDLRIEVRGPSGKLTRSALSEVEAVLDLSAVRQPGEQTFTLSSENLNLPTRVVFLRAVPGQLRLQFDRIQVKDVPVRLRTTGEPAPGYHVAQSEIVPSQLRIRGPEARVQQTSSAETDAIDVSGWKQDGEVRVSAFLADPRVQLDSPSIVTVKLKLERSATDP